MSAGYEISGSTSSTDAFQTSATSGFGGDSSFVGGTFNQGFKFTPAVILGGLAVLGLLLWRPWEKRRAK